MGIILGDKATDQSPETDDQTAYNRWLTRTVVQTLLINRNLPRGYVEGSISLILIGFAKAYLDGHDLAVTDLITYAQGKDNTARRYIALLEKDGWIDVSPADPDRRRLTEAGHIMVRKMWQRCRHLYETD
jgi:DNA-binding MarR family transcriptional regulator